MVAISDPTFPPFYVIRSAAATEPRANLGPRYPLRYHVHVPNLPRIVKAAVLCASLLLGPLFSPRGALATEVGTTRPTGVGFAVGEPTGIVAKHYVGPENAWDAGLSFFSLVSKCHTKSGFEACSSQTNIAINVDYLWQYPLIQGEVNLSWHFGAGARMWLFSADSAADNFAFAARMPIGVDMSFRKPEFLEAYIEFAPSLTLLPGVSPNLDPAIGLRFFF